jgi:hypothetical protein
VSAPPDPKAPPLPVVWLPRRSRAVAYTVAAALVAGSVVFAVLLPSRFQLPDRIGVVAFFCGIGWVLYMLGRSRVTADERGVTLVNAFRVHRYEWAELIGVHMAVGDPWPGSTSPTAPASARWASRARRRRPPAGRSPNSAR